MTRELLRECKRFIDERLIYPIGRDTATDLLDRIDAALASPEPEPVAFIEHHADGGNLVWKRAHPQHLKATPLYTADALCGRQGWQKVADAHPKPHARYLVRRARVVYTATPCYGMHNPWWVVQIMGDKYEAEPESTRADDEWQPLIPPFIVRERGAKIMEERCWQCGGALQPKAQDVVVAKGGLRFKVHIRCKAQATRRLEAVGLTPVSRALRGINSKN